MEFPEPREREALQTLRTRSVLSLLVFWSIRWLKSDKLLFGEELWGFVYFLKYKMVSILMIEVLYQVQARRTTFGSGVWCRLSLQTLQEDRARDQS